jgi:hypothetical protein
MALELGEMESFGSTSSNNGTSIGKNQQSKNKPLGKDVIISFIICITGWFGPKIFFLPSPKALAARQAPYQMTAAGDIILHFELNDPLVEPQTIPREYK